MKFIENRFRQAKFLVVNAAERGLAPDQAYGHVIIDGLRRFVDRTFNQNDLYSAVMGAASAIYKDLAVPGDILAEGQDPIETLSSWDRVPCGITVMDTVRELNNGDISILEAEASLKQKIDQDLKVWRIREGGHALSHDSPVPRAGGDRRGDGGEGSGT